MAQDMNATHRTRWPRRILTAFVTTGVIAGSAGSVLATRGALVERAEDRPVLPAAPLATVEVARIVMEPAFQIERRFAGQFEPPQSVQLAFEEGGTLDEVLVSEGDRVAPGQVIARLDTARLLAERAALAAARDGLAVQAELARRTNQRQAELRERGFATAQTVDDTSLGLARLEAAIAEAEAGISAADVRIEKAVIRAPFAGRVGTRMLDRGAIAAAGMPVLTLLEDGPVEFRAGLAPELARTLAPGDTAVIDTPNGPRDARLARLSPELDPTTRARIAIYEVVDTGPAPASRSAGEVRLTQTLRTDAPGAWVPLTALRQGPRGTWQMLVAEASGDTHITRAEAAEIIEVREDAAFVQGTFAKDATVIVSGVHRIVPGQPVDLSTANPEVLSWAR